MSPAETARAKSFILALLAMAQFVVVLDASIVNVALPSIGHDLDFAQDDLSWVVNAYTLTFGGFLLLGGRLADLLGGGGSSSTECGCSRSPHWSADSPRATSADAARARAGPRRRADLAGRAFDSHHHVRRGLRAQQGAGGLGRRRRIGRCGWRARSAGCSPSGPGWEWVLFVNVPIGIAAALVAPRLLAESRDDSSPSFDIAGAVTVTAGLALLVYTLVDANDAGWGSTQTIGLGALSLALLTAFVLIELRRRYPLIPFSIFRLRTLRGSNVIGLLLGMSLFAMFFFISLYMQQVMGYDPLKAGLAYLPLAGLIIISASGASRARRALRLQAGADHGHDAVRRRPAILVQPRERAGRHVRRRRPVPLDARRRGARPRLRARHDRGGHRHEASRGGPGVGPDQHLPAGRRRARTRGAGHDLHRRTNDVLAAGEQTKAVALTEGFQAAFFAGAVIALVGALLTAS